MGKKVHKIVLMLEEPEYKTLKLYRDFLEERNNDLTMTMQKAAKDLVDVGLDTFLTWLQELERKVDEMKGAEE